VHLGTQKEAEVVPSSSRIGPDSQRLWAQKAKNQEPQHLQNVQNKETFNQAQREKEQRQKWDIEKVPLKFRH
jgi:phosphoribosylaminoimidazole-succinocarboxamide synthase